MRFPTTFDGSHTLNRQLRMLCVVLISMALGACAAAPKIALQPETKQSIKRIALVEIPEPSEYFMNPGQLPGGAGLYAFGALGGLILGGIEASRLQAASSRFTESVLPHKPGISAALLEQLEIGLKQKGYDVTRIPPPPMTADGKSLDLMKIEGSYDAFLTGSLRGGYNTESGGVAPRLVASFSLLTKSGSEPLFAETYLYGMRSVGQAVHIASDPTFFQIHRSGERQ